MDKERFYSELGDIYGSLNQDKEVAVVIEAGYFEVHDLEAEDRIQHVVDSLEIYSYLKNKAGNISLCIFINDYQSNNYYCGFQACEVAQKLAGKKKIQKWSIVPATAKKLYKQILSENIESTIEVFSIRTTRNRAATSIKKRLAEDEIGLKQIEGGDITDIYVKIDNSSCYVGSRNISTGIMSVRCSALMAQHYFDIAQWVRKKNRSIQTVLIIDFNRKAEQLSVLAGSKITRKICNWPVDLNATVVNCVYDDNNEYACQFRTKV